MSAVPAAAGGLLALALHLVDDARCLAAPPALCARLGAAARADGGAVALDAVLGRDPRLRERVLAIAGSPWYGAGSGPVASPTEALAALGPLELHGLTVGVAAVQAYSRLPNWLVDAGTFWEHGICTGLAARALARRCHVLHPERMFVAGLLHDLGHLLLYHRLPEISRKLLRIAGGDEHVLHAAEQRELGFSHADLGAALLGDWNIPASIEDAIRWHHAPGDASLGRLEAAVLHLADNLADRAGGGWCDEATAGAPDPQALRIIGLSGAELEAIDVTEEVRRDLPLAAASLAAA